MKSGEKMPSFNKPRFKQLVGSWFSKRETPKQLHEEFARRYNRIASFFVKRQFSGRDYFAGEKAGLLFKKATPANRKKAVEIMQKELKAISQRRERLEMLLELTGEFEKSLGRFSAFDKQAQNARNEAEFKRKVLEEELKQLQRLEKVNQKYVQKESEDLRKGKAGEN